MNGTKCMGFKKVRRELFLKTLNKVCLIKEMCFQGYAKENVRYLIKEMCFQGSRFVLLWLSALL